MTNLQHRLFCDIGVRIFCSRVYIHFFLIFLLLFFLIYVLIHFFRSSATLSFLSKGPTLLAWTFFSRIVSAFHSPELMSLILGFQLFAKQYFKDMYADYSTITLSK